MSKTRKVEVTVSLDAPPEAVWQAITEAEEVKKWFAPEVRITPGAGGKIFVSWGEGMESEEPIEVFEPPTHFRHKAGEDPKTQIPIWIDYFVEAAEGTGPTTLRLVHSGFSESADWDAEIDSLERGWKVFMLNLRYYLERHRGERVVQTTFAPRFLPDRATVWRALMSKHGLDATGHLATAKAGDRLAISLPGGEPLFVEVELVIPERDLALTLEASGGALLRLGIARSTQIVTRHDGESTLIFGALLTYGEFADQGAALAERVSSAISRAVSVTSSKP